VKDKAFEDTRYVVELVAPDTVNTMPAATLKAVVDHGVARGDTIRQGYDTAWNTMDELERLGIDMADVASTLERQGVATFVKSWDELIQSVTEQVKSQGAQVNPEGSVKPISRDQSSMVPAAGLPA
jgi:transaldolase